MGKSIKKSLHNAPSKKTRWAYFMQAIEHVSEAINMAFPGYHPQWVIGSQNWKITAANFRYMRKIMLCVTAQQCAAYLRVPVHVIRQWETGKEPVPFMAFELLRIVYESTHFKMSHPDWAGWFIGKDGRLVSPDIGKHSVAPADINLLAQKHIEAAQLQFENKRLNEALAEAQSENTRLREQFVNQGVVDEIDAMRDRLSDLLARLNTARVYPFPQQSDHQPQKEAAA